MQTYAFVTLTGIWDTVTCIKESGAAYFSINMGVDECDIIQTGNCSRDLVRDGFLQDLCSVLDNGETYTCNISSTYTEPVCCVNVNKSSLLSSISCWPSKSHKLFCNV